MRAELTQIDLSAIEELVRIRKEEIVLEERLAKMEARNAKVSPIVYARVREDYEARRSELVRGAQPLREKALREYQRLKILRLALERAVQQLTLEKEELEFRRDLGEFPENEFAQQAAACQGRLDEERRDLEELLRLRSAFVSAFRSEEELESAAPLAGAPAAPAPAGPAPAPPPPAPAVPPPPAPAPPPRAAAPSPAPPVHAPMPPAGAREHEDALTPDGTAIAVPRHTPSMATPPPAPAPEPPAHHSATAILPRARLSLLQGKTPVKDFVLKPGVSVIGRLAASDIQLPSPDVSRRHAQITVGADGCFVSDLGSENGVAVNGRLVETHHLVDGDVIVLGKQELVFRE
jgi:hypothetical protein